VKELLERLVHERERTLAAFVDREGEQLALACHALARALARGGTLIVYGEGAAETDAAHVAVEFVHPVIVGKRALPALAPPTDVLAVARPGDVALAISHGGPDRIDHFLAESRRRGLLTLAFTGRGRADADFPFAVEHDDEGVVQEVQETAYHVLWELVHVFFEHPGLLADACITCGDVAVEARVVSVEGTTAVVETGGQRERVALDFIENGVAAGDTVLCHAGVALERLA
jgi:D-sedoheptulose 7-phosphate isomerase